MRVSVVFCNKHTIGTDDPRWEQADIDTGNENSGDWLHCKATQLAAEWGILITDVVVGFCKPANLEGR